jgi:hypothetical protein
MKALTGNRLDDGEVVFLGASGDWVGRFGEARFFEEDASALAAEAHAKTEITRIVDPYLIDVATVEGGWAPVAYRERLRALGPTNRHDHGKQAEGGEDVEALLHAAGSARSKGRVDLIRRK